MSGDDRTVTDEVARTIGLDRDRRGIESPEEKRNRERREQLLADHGLPPTAKTAHFRFDASGDAMAFVIAARERGWDVHHPVPNGFKDVHHVEVFWFSLQDQDLALYYRAQAR